MFRSLGHWPAVVRTLRSSQGAARPPRRSRGYNPSMPALERLEARSVPSVVTITVNTLVDETIPNDQTSLREAIITADGDRANSYVIKFGVTGTIDLTSDAGGTLDLGNNIAIRGPGASSLTVQRDSAAASFGIFRVDSPFKASISGITISNGAGVTGGGIDNEGTLTVSDSVFSSNSASRDGGGLYNETSGTARVSGCSFTSNSATFKGGGLFNL